jgi:hypothetical protein
MQPHEYLRELLQQRQTLLAILKDMDPASGVTFMVRRGVAADSEDYDDRLSRPWATIQVAELGEARYVILGLLRANMSSIRIFMRSTSRLIGEAEETLAEANRVTIEEEG